MAELTHPNISVLLVETKHTGNVGAAARAMKNMGLSRLKLVRPPHLDERARNFAVTAGDLIENAETYETLAAAVADEQLLIGTTSIRGRRPRTQLHDVRQLAPLIRTYARTERVCILFGPERTGLTEKQLSRCQYLVTIPTDDRMPTLNVAQAVLIVCYEIFLAADPEVGETLDLATQEEREGMFDQLQETLIQVGFLSQSNPEHIMRSIRRFLGKADLTPRDIKILRGICTQMQWFVEKGHQLEPNELMKP